MPVRGASQSLINDTSRHKIQLIPNDLYDFLEICREHDLHEILHEIYTDDAETAHEYIDFITKLEFGFFSRRDLLNHFPPIDMQWDFPAPISNAIIEFNLPDFQRLETILKQLDQLHTPHVELRFYRKISAREIREILVFLKHYPGIESFDLIAEFDPEIEAAVQHLFLVHLALQTLILYNAPEKKIILSEQMLNSSALLVPHAIQDNRHCGQISKSWFSSNLQFVTEGVSHNTCLNRKIAIDPEGNIRNCPSLPQAFGHIDTTPLSEVLQNPEFKQLWTITKNQVDVCKVCEFRTVCTDCRAYLENPEDRFSKPLKCGYDPYTNQWEDWTTHPMKQEAIEFYKISEIILMRDRIEA
jgi:SPASM domain peptide maturase of grasp-with-spasm system